jgi:hypothetical protein
MKKGQKMRRFKHVPKKEHKGIAYRVALHVRRTNELVAGGMLRPEASKQATKEMDEGRLK